MLIKLMQNPIIKAIYIGITNICSIIPDRVYLKILYRLRTGQKLHLNPPITFNEKIQWLKINDNDENHSKMVDKYAVREYISEKLGEDYLIPLIGVYDNANDIDIEQLPKEFVIKCTHDSGSVFLCKKHEDFSPKIRNSFNKALKRKYYYASRENLYKGVTPKLVIEEMMHNSDGKGLTDYKFYCFDGEPRFLYVSAGLEDHTKAKISFYNIDLSDAPFQRSDYAHFDKIPNIPKCYDEMIMVAKKLSEGIPFVRVDLYEINEQVYFSELTFSPCSGMMPFEPKEYDKKLGEMIKI